MAGAKEQVQITATAKDQASAVLKKLQGNVAALGSKGRGPLGGLLGGLGAISPVALAAGFGIGAMTGLLAEGVKGAIEEEKQLAALSQALKDNVKGWDGSTAAMNDAARAAEDFAFTDDDARASLTKLVVATGDQTTAIKDMNLAMDIARGRNIDLAAATDIVVKANMGNVGALRRLGIEVKKGASSTEILAELTQRYAGQAAAFADTTEGKMQTARIAIDELAEDFGSLLVPAIGDAAAAMSEFMSNFNRPKAAVESVKDTFLAGMPTPADVQAAITRLEDLRHSMQFGPALDPKTWLFGMDIGGVRTEIDKQIGDLQAHLRTLDPRDESARAWLSMSQAAPVARKAVDDIVTATEPEWHRLGVLADQAAQDSVDNLADTMRKGKDVGKNAMDDLLFAMNHPLKREKLIAKLEGELTSNALAEGLASNDPAIVGAAQYTRSLLIDQWEKLTGLSYENGVRAGNAYAKGVANGRLPIFRTPVAGSGGGEHHYSGGGRAAGGPVNAGETYLIGERGPELLHMGRGSGYVQANGAGHGHDIYLDGAKVGSTIDRWQGRQLALAPSSTYSR